MASYAARSVTAAPVAVPGMPIGSPGMEVEGAKAQPYNVVSFDKQGVTRVFAKH